MLLIILITIKIEKIEIGTYNIEISPETGLYSLSLTIFEEYLDNHFTNYELWINNEMLGDRTPIGKSFVHSELGIDTLENPSARIKMYHNDIFVDEYKIDSENKKIYFENKVIIRDNPIEQTH